jgi:hypothetical protein
VEAPRSKLYYLKSKAVTKFSALTEKGVKQMQAWREEHRKERGLRIKRRKKWFPFEFQRAFSTSIYIYICVCVCVCVTLHIYINTQMLKCIIILLSSCFHLLPREEKYRKYVLSHFSKISKDVFDMFTSLGYFALHAIDVTGRYTYFPCC